MSSPSIKKTGKVRSILINLIIILAVTVIMFALLEGLLRLVFGRPENLSLKYSPYQHHPSYQIALKPNFTDTFVRSKENGGDTIVWKTNSKGFRGAELSADHDYRIVIYGDSNILARFSREENTFVAQLKTQLEHQYPGKKIETINSGIVGAGTDQLVLKMKEDLPVLNPDLVILHIFASNDMGDMIRNRLFHLQDDKSLALTGFPVLPDTKIRTSRLLSSVKGTRIYQIAGKIRQRISKAGSIESPEQAIENVITVSEQEYRIYKDNLPKVFSHFDDHYDIDVATQPASSSSVMKVLLLDAVLAEAKSICESAQVELMILIEPPVFDLCQNHLFGPDNLKAYGNYNPENLSKSIDSVCRKQNLDCLNLYPIFSSSHPENLYFKINDDHWNDAGQKLAAVQTADFIIKQGLLRNR